MNVLLELIVCENLWPLQIFLYTFIRVYTMCVSSCTFVYIYVYMYVYPCIHTRTLIYFQVMVFPFSLFLPELNVK